jgi:excisionase family DNA binding protein
VVEDVEMLTTKSAAAIAGVTERTIRNWCESGELPALKAGRKWQIPRPWLEQKIAFETLLMIQQANAR